MEVFTLDSSLRREYAVDDYESLIWTDRFSAFGDFNLVLKDSTLNRQRFLKGTRLAIHESIHVMIVETIESKISEEGEPQLEVSGRSLESILESRSALESLTYTSPNKKWTLTGKPSQVIRDMFHAICRLGTLSSGDVIPFVQAEDFTTEFYPMEHAQTITWMQSPETLYSAIQSLCEVYTFGFRIVRPREDSKLYFNVYPGLNRKTNQTFRQPIIFSSNLDNLLSVTTLDSIVEYKNVAYVTSDQMKVVVYAPGTSSTVSGFDRRVLTLIVTDLEPLEEANPKDIPDGMEGRALYYAALDARNAAITTRNTALMNQRGSEELAKRRNVAIVDGELNTRNSYKFRVDYDLGDLVEVQDPVGFRSIKRVTEHILVSDENGVRSYPTLTHSND